MIDLQDVYEKDEFQEAIENFKYDKKWNIFIEPFLRVTNNKCPYCEVYLPRKIENRNMIATIDHYRPKEYYPTLKNVYQNYILMCSDCNNAFKGNKFLIYENKEVVEVNEKITDRIEIKNEQTIIVNPIKDNIFDMFILRFKLTKKGKILELSPKYTENENKYLFLKAKETIKIFALGDCEEIDYNKEHIRCRFELLKQYFSMFYDFVIALQNKEKGQALEIFKNKKLKEYGFIEFIKKKLFKVEI